MPTYGKKVTISTNILTIEDRPYKVDDAGNAIPVNEDSTYVNTTKTVIKDMIINLSEWTDENGAELKSATLVVNNNIRVVFTAPEDLPAGVVCEFNNESNPFNIYNAMILALQDFAAL